MDIGIKAAKNVEKALEENMSFPRRAFSLYMKFFYEATFIICTIIFGFVAGCVMGVLAPVAIPAMVLWNRWKTRAER